MKSGGGITVIQGLTQNLGILSQHRVPLAVPRVRAGLQGRRFRNAQIPAAALASP